MAEYLRALEPVLTPQQYEKTKAIVTQFMDPAGLGPTLQQYLLDKRELEDNWVSFYCFYSLFLSIYIYFLNLQNIILK